MFFQTAFCYLFLNLHFLYVGIQRRQKKCFLSLSLIIAEFNYQLLNVTKQSLKTSMVCPCLGKAGLVSELRCQKEQELSARAAHQSVAWGHEMESQGVCLS